MALTPGDRVDFKRKIARTLARQDWSDIDLKLQEFGLPAVTTWRGDKVREVLEALSGSQPDEALAGLNAYLHPADAPTAPPQPESFDDPANPWVGQGLRLFLSHVHTYAEQAGALRHALAERSVDAFVAHDSIEPTEEWENVIIYALRSCDACLALLTPGFKESNWADQETGFCMARNLLIIPVEFGLVPYGLLGRYQALRAKRGQDPADIALSVFELLVRKEQSRDAMASALVNRWATTGSFSGARDNYSFLKKIPREAWTQPLINEVWEARDRNDQLRDANINWRPSEQALEELFSGLPYARPTRTPQRVDDDIPF
jgi:hypothetical protein